MSAPPTHSHLAEGRILQLIRILGGGEYALIAARIVRVVPHGPQVCARRCVRVEHRGDLLPPRVEVGVRDNAGTEAGQPREHRRSVGDLLALAHLAH